MRTFIRRKPGSAGARRLARELGVRLIRDGGSRYRYRPGDVIINWGNSEPMPGVPDSAYVNHPAAVATAIDKRETWSILEGEGIPTVEWTTDHSEALRWMREHDDRCFVRTTLRGTKGIGMEAFSRDGTEWTRPMYEMFDEGHTYVKVFGRNPRNVDEYRIHVAHGEVIDRQQKRRRNRNEYEGRIDPYIRSHDRGWVFCREGLVAFSELDKAAKEAVEALGLDFGAVDCARSRRSGEVCVYEVNSAPGLEGTTIGVYRSLA